MLTFVQLHLKCHKSMAEMEGFEPPHVLRRLADFESAPFSRLGTSPYGCLLYHLITEKSRFFRKFQNFGHFFHDLAVIFPAVGAQAVGAILDAVGQILEAAAAFVAQGVEGAVAENAGEGFRVGARMAGEILAFPVLEKVVMAHVTPPSRGRPGAARG